MSFDIRDWSLVKLLRNFGADCREVIQDGKKTIGCYQKLIVLEAGSGFWENRRKLVLFYGSYMK